MRKSHSSPPQSIEPTSSPAPVEPTRAQRYFETVLPALEAIPRDRLRPVNVDPQAAAVVAIGVAELIRQPSLRARLEKLVAIGELSGHALTQLLIVAFATWYARQQYLLAMAQRSEARVPAALSAQGYEQRGRMLKLAGYYFDDDPVESPRLAAIREGSGYLDLANDLAALADFCEQHHAVLSHDRKHYRSDDVARARQLSEQIIQALGMSTTPEEPRWNDLQTRAFTLLVDTYEQVARAGRFLLADTDGDTRFPSLVTAARSAPTSSTPPAPPSSPAALPAATA